MSRTNVGKITRRTALLTALAGGLGACVSGMRKTRNEDMTNAAKPASPRVPVIDITDLYHPPQDPGDNIDLVAAYGLPEIDLRAVILDVTGRYRRPYHNPADPSYDDPAGARDPGFVPVTQLNYLYGRDVPCAAGPFELMKAPDDPMLDAPPFQQAGIDLMLKALRESKEPVDVLSFGSTRPAAVAYNREPELMREKMRCLHLCAGGAPAGYWEWNVQLDPHAFVRILKSDLPVAIYPCATEKSPVDLGPNNCYWQLPDRGFIRRMHPRLRSYLTFAIDRSTRMDFLCAVEDDPSEEALQRVCGGPHNVWETAVWTQVAGRRLVRRADGTGRLLPATEVLPTDQPVREYLQPCRVDVRPDGQFDFEPVEKSNLSIYTREDPQAYQAAVQEAFTALYESFTL